jgi:hypothetical protein
VAVAVEPSGVFSEKWRTMIELIKKDASNTLIRLGRPPTYLNAENVRAKLLTSSVEIVR